MLYHKHLAEKIATKTDQRYDQLMTSIRSKLSFLIMRSALFCLRGSRTIKVNTDVVDDFSFACDEARLRVFKKFFKMFIENQNTKETIFPKIFII